MNQSPIMSPNDVSTLLQIKESTLRKYSILLENVGYAFQRNNQNQRWYNDTDIVAFKKLISLKNSTDMNLKECAEAVLLWSKGGNVTQDLTTVDNDTKRYNDDITELKAMVNQQNELLQELVKKIDQQQKYIDTKLEERDKRLLESVRGTQEIKQQLLQIAAAKEEKKGFFARLFNK
jgi:DNA-binding transcriptional MerR regulator